MPNDILHACHEGVRVDAQVMGDYQSVVMSDWTYTDRYRLSSNGCKVNEINEGSDAEHAKYGSVHAGAIGEAYKDTRVTHTNEVEHEKSKKVRLDSKSLHSFREKSNGISSLKREWGKDKKFEIEGSSGDDNVSLYRTRSHLLSTSAHAPPRTETLGRKYQLLSKDISSVSPLMNSRYAVEKNNLAVSTSLWNGFVKPASDRVTIGYGKRKTSMPPSTPGQHDVYQSSYKCSEGNQKSPRFQVVITSVGEDNKRKLVYVGLSDINQEPPEVPTLATPVVALASTEVDREISISKTHSLYVEHPVSHADEHARSKSGNSSLGPDPSSIWVKRLKLCLPSSVPGTKSATIEEIYLNKKVNNIFSKMKGNKTSLEPNAAYHTEVQVVADLCATVLTNDKSFSTKENKTAEITLSHPWIRRWSHNPDVSPRKRHELAELHKQKSSNTPEEFQKKQFPSIAAMVMAGKAMNCLNPSELLNKGSVVVWNMKGF